MRDALRARTKLGLSVLAAMLIASATTWIAAAATGRSGEVITCGSGHWRVDNAGREWPVSVRVVSPPANGKVTTRTQPQTVTLRNGQQKTVRVTQVLYQSKKGFVGQDSFTYVRTSADPTDPNNRSHTITVTVR